MKGFSYREARAAMQAAESEDDVSDDNGGWRDISTAPKDGTKVLTATRLDHRIGSYENKQGITGWWCDGCLYAPIHWQPLPPPPKGATP